MSESIYNGNESSKTKEFRSNTLLNSLLQELQYFLSPSQRDIEMEFTENRWPFVFIVGSTRSGTTLILQWLASLGFFSYPSNFLTRFAYAPYVGALIQKMLFDKDYDFHGDFYDIQSSLNFDSELGKSKGALATNEFQHFFRNYTSHFDPQFLDDEALRQVDFQGIKKGLTSIEYAFDKPFVTKAAMFKYNIPEFYAAIPKSIFLYIKRDPMLNMQSLLFARMKYFNDYNLWYGSKPKEYHKLRDLDIYSQIAGQVYFTNQSIEKAFERMPAGNKLVVDYERFCEDPGKFYEEVRDKYRLFGYDIKSSYNGPEKFSVSNTLTLDKEQAKKLETAYNRFVEHGI